MSPQGDLDTKTITVSELLHPFAEVPETTYEVVMAGDAIGEEQVLQLNPVLGCQVYVEEPVALNCVLEPGVIC